MVFLGSSGSEAMEAALKVAEQAQGPQRSKIIYAENSFHGKTKGTLAITDGAALPVELQSAVEQRQGAVRRHRSHPPRARIRSAIGIVCLETIQGGGGINVAPPAYWQELRALCDKHDVLWIADEVQCGLGRSGKFYAFEHCWRGAGRDCAGEVARRRQVRRWPR